MVSACRWPSIGCAPAAEILAGTLDGPGPSISRLGTIKGCNRHCGGRTDREDILLPTH